MWCSVAIETDAECAEALADILLEQGAVSVSMEDAAAGSEAETPQFDEPDNPGNKPLWASNRVIALFEPAHDLAHRVAAAMQQVRLENAKVEWTEVAEQDWVRLTQSQFEPLCINDRLWIVPSWHEAPDPRAINLALDPGLAFGTGSHPTTHLCLDWLCQHVKASTHILDYGCGSGILGIAAARLGAATVTGVDIDERALEAAADNATRNQVALRLLHSSAELTESFDMVVANILTNPLCVLAPLLAARVAPGGFLVLAGVLASQSQQVIEAYQSQHIHLEVGAEKEGWVRLEGEKAWK